MKARLVTELYHAEFFFLQRLKHGPSRGKAVRFSWKLFHEEIHFFFICRTASGSVESLEAELHLDNKVRFIFNVSPSE